MQTLILDVETTFQGKYKSGDTDNSPYNKLNKLVSIGAFHHGDLEYFAVDHSTEPMPKNLKHYFQMILDDTELLVGHNIKFDLSWILECGWRYEGQVWDTMAPEYVEAQGIILRGALTLEQSCKRHGIEGKLLAVEDGKSVSDYWTEGIPTDQIPWNVLRAYGERDVLITEKLFRAQLAKHDPVIANLNDELGF